MRGRRRQRLERLHDDAFDPAVINSPRRTRPWLVAQPLQTTLNKPAAPLPDRALINAQVRGNVLVLLALGALQNDPRPQRQGLSRVPSSRQRLKLSPLRLAENQRLKPSPCHPIPPRAAKHESGMTERIGDTANFRFGTLAVTRPVSDGTLLSRTVTVAGRRTSVRLEPMMWEALKEVCLREQASRSALVTKIARERAASSLTSAIRLYILGYFRAAADEDGHRAAGHGALPRRFLFSRAGVKLGI